MKLTKKLFIGIMTLALVVVTFTTSTFAWFTIGTTGQIKDVQVNVTAGTGMEISKDGTAWKNVIELDNPTGLNFTAVTTLDGMKFYNAEYGELDKYTTGENPVIAEGSAAGKNVMYYEKEFYVRIRTSESSPITKVVLTEVNGTHPENTESTDWTADVSLGTSLDTNSPVYTHYKNGNDNADAIIEGQAKVFDALNAVKVSFAKVTNGTNAETITVLYGYEKDNSWGTMPAVDGTSKKVESGLAYDYAEAKGYDMTKVQPVAINSNATALPTYVSYTSTETTATGYDVTKVTVLSNVNDSENNITSDFVSAATAKASGGILANKTLDDGYIYAKVVIRIWLDGWDPDCINAILAQQTKFTFKLKAE